MAQHQTINTDVHRVLIGIAAFNEHGELEYQDSITIRRSITNAELELMALIEGLEYAQDGDVIYSDSDYCVKGYNLWLDDWKDRGWRRADKKPVKNRHLWQQIDELRSKKYVEVRKVKAHSGDKGNDMADLLALEAAEAD